MKEVGQTICTCLGVTDVAIKNWLKNHPGEENSQLDGLKTNLKCGTECGSCVPQLKRMINHKVFVEGMTVSPSLTI